MTTVTSHRRQETRQAWSDYAERLRGLEGVEYDQAEEEAWDQLQATLRALGAGGSQLDDPAVG